MVSSASHGAFETFGFAEIADTLKSLADKHSGPVADKIMKDSLMEAAIVVRDAAKKEAPKKTGRLELFIGRTVGVAKEGILVVKVGNIVFKGKHAKKAMKRFGRLKRGQHMLGMELSRDAFYAKFVEFGTKHQAANPFLHRAFIATKEDFTKVLAEKLRANLDKWAAKQRRAAA